MTEPISLPHQIREGKDREAQVLLPDHHSDSRSQDMNSVCPQRHHPTMLTRAIGQSEAALKGG